MKKIRSVLIIAMLMVTFNAVSQTKEIIYIRIQENIWIQGAGAHDSYMSIIYPDQPAKRLELSKIKQDGKAAEENGKIIHTEITQLINNGYEINSCSVGGDSNATTTVMILVRKKEK